MQKIDGKSPVRVVSQLADGQSDPAHSSRTGACTHLQNDGSISDIAFDNTDLRTIEKDLQKLRHV